MSPPPAAVQGAIQRLSDSTEGNAAVYQRVRRILEDPSIDSVRRRELIFALDRAATPEAFQMLVQLSQMDLPATLKTQR